MKSKELLFKKIKEDEQNWKNGQKLSKDLFQYCSKYLYNFLNQKFYKSFSYDQLNDIVSDVWEKFTREQDEIRTRFSKIKLTSWLCVVGKNICLDMLCHRKIKKSTTPGSYNFRDIDEVYESDLSECNISRDFDEIDNRFKQVKGLLNEQEPWIQRCFEMKYLEDRKLEDIYSEMNNKEWNYKTKNQVIYQMFKTREFLRTQLNNI
jgi:DNA-directed RNA polymerase specialized sigma24 family protein